MYRFKPFKIKTSINDVMPIERKMKVIYMTMITSKCVGVVSLRYPRQGGYERFTSRGTGYAPQGKPARH